MWDLGALRSPLMRAQKPRSQAVREMRGFLSGALYRELINFPQYYQENKEKRRMVLNAMYRELGCRTPPYLVVLQNQYFWWGLATCVILTLETGIISSFLAENRTKEVTWILFLPCPFDFVSTLPFIFGFVACIMIYLGLTGLLLSQKRNSETSKMIRDLRASAIPSFFVAGNLQPQIRILNPRYSSCESCGTGFCVAIIAD